MNRPEWKDAPEWAMFLAQDKDGEWCWWNLEPALTYSLWTQGEPGDSYRFETAGYYECKWPWMETLEPRP
jgi:hypothetical protein